MVPYEDLSGYQLCHLRGMNEVLREKRVVNGLTQKQVADHAKISVRQYQRLETGERDIMRAPFQQACRVLEALGINIVKFHHGDYALGEEVFLDKEGLKYVKTGKLVSEDVE